MATGDGLTISSQDDRVDDKGQQKKKRRPRRNCGVCNGCLLKQKCTNPKGSLGKEVFRS